MKTKQRSFVVEIKSPRRRLKAAPKSIWGDADFKALVREAEASYLFKLDVVVEALSQDEGRLSNSKPQKTPADINFGDEQKIQAPLIAPINPARCSKLGIQWSVRYGSCR